MNKYHFTFDRSKKNIKLIKIFKKKYKNFSPKTCNVIVVLGGDGFMLKTIKKYHNYKKPFYGINRGTFGFLMNKFKSHDIHKNIIKAKSVKISPLEMKVKTNNNKNSTSIAINDVSLLRQSRQTAYLQIKKGNKYLIRKLISDGVLISTPAGSTAYNLSIHGPILSLNSKMIAVTPISPFRPRRWKGKILSSSSIINIINLNTEKRPVSAVADNFEVRNIKKVTVRINNSIKFRLLYDRHNSLSKKIKLEQIRKQVN